LDIVYADRVRPLPYPDSYGTFSRSSTMLVWLLKNKHSTIIWIRILLSKNKADRCCHLPAKLGSCPGFSGFCSPVSCFCFTIFPFSDDLLYQYHDEDHDRPRHSHQQQTSDHRLCLLKGLVSCC